MSSLLGEDFVPPPAFLVEVLLTSDSSGQLWNSCVWDPSSGSSLTTYKGSTTAPRTTTFLGDSFLVSAQPTKPVLNVWQVNRHEQQPGKITTPGVVTALCASPSGKHVVASVDEKVYLWQSSNGALLRVLEGHYQAVTCLAFTDDGSHFISAGKDGNVLVWSLLEAVARQAIPGQKREEVNSPVPKHTWSDSKLAVTDIYVTGGGVKARVATVSLDQTCKIFCLLSGRLLQDILFAARLNSVTMDPAETKLFVGSETGVVYMFPLLSPPRNVQVSRSEDNCSSFVGHKKAVTVLSVSMDGQTLASGSNDNEVKLWSIFSKECVRTLEHKGNITFLKFVMPVNGMLKPDTFRQSVYLSQLQKVVFDAKDDVTTEIFVGERSQEEEEGVEEDDDENRVICSAQDQRTDETEDVKKLRKINLQLYQYAVQNILTKNS